MRWGHEDSLRLVAQTLVLLILGTLLPTEAGGEPVVTGRVRIYSTPSGASVYINDTQSAPVGVTPFRGRVPVGEQTFIIRLEGYEAVHVAREVTTRRTTRVNEALQLAAYLDLQAGDEASFGAEVEVSGLPAGRLPAVLELPEGRHLVAVIREGYEPFEQWFTLTPGETQVGTVTLGVPIQGSILVTADVEGASVWLDGEERGPSPLLLEGVSVGDHEVALNAPGWRPYVLTVTVAPGERATLSAAITQTRGELQIIGNVEGAEVRLNGAVVGEVPFHQRDVRVGEHILEVRANGYEPLQETITILGGMRRVLGIQLEPSAGPVNAPSRQALVITSDLPGANVTVDGRDLGPAPATLVDIPAGSYEIEVTAADHQPYRTRCTVAEGQSCTRNAALYQSARRLQLTSPADGAVLFVDGRPVGPLPYDGGLPEGDVELTVRADGYQQWSMQVEDGDGTLLELEAGLRLEGEGPPGLLLHSGFTVPPSLMALDLSAGWPTLLEARFDIGILPMIDVGGAVRTFGRLTEIEARGRYSFAPVDFFVVGGAGRLGGGGGPRGVNTFFVLLEANATVHWDQRLSATVIQGLDFYTDSYPYAETDSDVPAAATGRQNTVAYRLGVAFDVAFRQAWSLWANLEWTAAATKSRRVLGDLFGFGGEAARVSARLGIGFVF